MYGLAGIVTFVAVLIVGAMCWPQDSPSRTTPATPTRPPAASNAPGGQQGPATYTLADLGVTLAYARENANGIGTLVLEAPDGRTVDVNAVRGIFTGIAWSPDGQQIAVSYGPSPTQQDVYVVSVSDGSIAQVTRDGHSRRPTWSPDGQALAFSNSPDGTQGHGPVAKAPVGGGPATPLSKNPADDNPAWAPDGETIAVSREPGSTILISATTGEDTRRIDWLHDSAPTYSSFVWSGDGTAIAGVIRRGTDLAVVVVGDGLTSQRQVGGAFLGNPADPASIHPSFVPGFPKLIAASATTGDLVLLDLSATPADAPSTEPYAPVQVIVPAPRGAKLTFPSVRTPRPTGRPGSLVSFPFTTEFTP